MLRHIEKYKTKYGLQDMLNGDWNTRKIFIDYKNERLYNDKYWRKKEKRFLFKYLWDSVFFLVVSKKTN